jgi:hypothetical protein
VLRDPKKTTKQKRTEEQAHLRAIGVDPLRAAPFSHPLFKTAHHHHHRWLFNHYFFLFLFSNIQKKQKHFSYLFLRFRVFKKKKISFFSFADKFLFFFSLRHFSYTLCNNEKRKQMNNKRWTHTTTTAEGFFCFVLF